MEDHYDTGEYGPAGRGFGKTHQLLIDFSANAMSGEAASADELAFALARRADEPLRAFCTPEHYDPSGTFRADLPAGDYEAELTFALRGSGTREGPVKMEVTLQGERVLTDFDGGSYDEPVELTHPVRIEPDGHLEVRLESAGGENEWGISAMVVRRVD